MPSNYKDIHSFPAEKPGNIGHIIAWAMFDWANSAFPTIVTTFVFATYFTQKIAVNKIVGTSQWGDAIGFASLIIALLSPLLGAIADYEGRRKPWLGLFTIFCIISAALLWFAEPSSNYVLFTLGCVIVGLVGLEVGMVFYNSMLNDLAPKNYVGRISGWGWGFGYFGGLTSLSIALFVFIENKIPGIHLNIAASEHVRACGPLVAVWFLVFAWPLFVFVPDRLSTGVGKITAVKMGVSSLINTLRSVRQYKEVLKFLIARILYIDGLNTIFAFGGIYAAGTFHMSFQEVLKFGITLNIGAGIGAGIFAWMDDFKGAKPTILLALGLMIVSGTGMLLVTTKMWFWIFGVVLSLCVGPIQAASRSLLIHLSPPELITEMFGLYAFSGKATAFIGPWVLSLATLLSGSQRIGMSTVMIFLVLGMSLLFTVKPKNSLSLDGPP